MTMLNTDVRNVLTSAGGTSFAYTFKIYDETHIKVIVADSDGQNPSTKTLGVDYTVSGVGVDAGGNVVFASAVTSGKKVILVLNTPLTQTLDLATADDLPAESVEAALDRLSSQVNTLKAQVRRAVLLPESTISTADGVTLPDHNITANQGKHLRVVSGGLDLVTVAATDVGNPLSAKGDLLTRDASVLARLAVGANDTVLVADSAQSLGIKWQALSSHTLFSALSARVSRVSEDTLPMLINGIPQVWQRGTSFTGVSTSQRVADMWTASENTDGSLDVSRSTNVPSIGSAGVLYPYSISCVVGSTDATIGAAQSTTIELRVEGQNWLPYAQRDLVLEFWTAHSLTGLYSICLTNGVDRSFIGTYTQSVANTWQRNTITISASPSAGTWNYTTGLGASIIFTMAAGTDHHGSTGSWLSTTDFASASQVNMMATTSNTFRLTGVRLCLGTEVYGSGYTSFGVELERCQRYYRKSFNYTTTPASAVGSATGESRLSQAVAASTFFDAWTIPFGGSMRSAPAMTLYNPAAAGDQVRNLSASTDCSGSSATYSSTEGFNVQTTTAGGSVVGHTLGVHWVAEIGL